VLTNAAACHGQAGRVAEQLRMCDMCHSLNRLVRQLVAFSNRLQACCLFEKERWKATVNDLAAVAPYAPSST
jgi:hypothetical protein